MPGEIFPVDEPLDAYLAKDQRVHKRSQHDPAQQGDAEGQVNRGEAFLEIMHQVTRWADEGE